MNRIQSVRPLGMSTTTLAYLRHPETGERVAVADVEGIGVAAYSGSKRLAIYTEELVVASVLSDTATVTPATGPEGKTFEHTIAYGPSFQPKSGETVDVEYVVRRTGGLGPIIFVHSATYSPVRTRVA